MARFIANLIAWGILFLSLGTLGQITLELAHKAGAAQRTGLVELRKVNGMLTGTFTGSSGLNSQKTQRIGNHDKRGTHVGNNSGPQR